MTNNNLEEKHLCHPEVGDVWHEMFTPILKVIGVDGDLVKIVRPKNYFDANGEYVGWKWDDQNNEITTKSELRAYLSYNQMPGYWARVKPKT